MQTLSIPFGPWVPDRPDFGGQQTMRAEGVIPAAAGFRPFSSGYPNGAALPSRCLGAAMLHGSGDTVFTVAGTADKLYVRANAGWEEKGGGYNLEEGAWSFAQYGNVVVAANGVDPVQYAEITGPSLTAFQPLPEAPQAARAAVVGDFMVLGNLEGKPGAVQWSKIDDPLSWPAPGSNDAQYGQSDIQIFPEGGAVQAIVSGMSGYEGLVFCERAVYRMQYVGPPYVFQFTAVDKSVGATAPDSVLHYNNLVYFIAENGFYATDGAAVRNIGAEKINLWWSSASSDSRRGEVAAAADPINGVVVFAYASPSAPAHLFDSLLIYHPQLDAFSTAKMETERLYNDCSRGITLEDLNAYGPLDTLPFSLDAKNLIRDVRMLSAFDASHTPRLFAGPSLAATLETAERGGEQTLVHGVRALVDGSPVNAFIKSRSFLKDQFTEKACALMSKLDGICRCRVATRYARATVGIPAGTEWTHVTGVELFVEPGGWK